MDNLLYYAVPGFVILLMLEFLSDRKANRKLYETRDTFASLAMGAGNLIVSAVVKGIILTVYLSAYRFRVFEIPVTWWSWILLLFAEDFCYYWFHRVHHVSRIFWAAHVNHHSSQLYNFSTALRQSWTTPVTGFVFWLPLPLLGFHPSMIFIQMSISLIYQFWIHTCFISGMGIFEWIFNTPSHHRVHHGANPQYIDKNHAGIFIIWDRLFGTFEPEAEPVRFGLTKNIHTYNPVKIAFHEWISMMKDMASARSFRKRIRFCFGHPAWKPDMS